MNREQDYLSDLALTTFRLNGQFLELAENLSRPAGLTASQWQVLGAVLRTPRTQADIARQMGITRQSVSRTASQLLAKGLLETIPNPGHKSAPLLSPTKDGFDSVRRIDPQHAEFAKKLLAHVGDLELRNLVENLKDLTRVMDEMSEA